MSASFPNRVWDGQSGAREDILVNRPPDNIDWNRIVAELAATQAYLLALQETVNNLSGGGGSGVSSVGLSLPNIFDVTVSPITSSGSLTAILANESANLIFSGPTTGSAAAPTFRGLVTADLPTAIPNSNLANSSITISSHSLSLGGTLNLVAGDISGLANSATIDATNADNISSGTLNSSLLPSIPNDKLVNSSIIINTHLLSLGGSLSLTTTDIGLGNVTNDTQTKASIVPNTAPSAGKILIGNTGGTAYAPQSISGDGTLDNNGVLVVTATNGSAFASSATVDTTNADNISSGTLNIARLPTTGLVITQHSGSIITATDGATVTFNLSQGDWQQVQIAGDRVLALSSPTVGQQFTLSIQQDATGNRIVTWFSGILWPSGIEPTLTTTPNKKDIFTFKCISSGVYLGFTAGQSL